MLDGYVIIVCICLLCDSNEHARTTVNTNTMNTSKMGKRIASKFATTRLERAALAWMNERGEDYEAGAAGAWKDLAYGGCSSGMVSHLIYTRDCVAFYRRHRKDIAALLATMLDEHGIDGPRGLFGDKWEANDPLANDDPNRNLLAWFGFEEAARTVANRAGFED